MPKLICTSRFIKNPKTSGAGDYIKYMGTREGVEKLSDGYDNKPTTQKQHALICDLLTAYPPAWEYPEMQEYISEHTKGAATKCITHYKTRSNQLIPLGPNRITNLDFSNAAKRFIIKQK